MTVGLDVGGGLTLTPNGLEYGIPIGTGLAIAITSNNTPHSAEKISHNSPSKLQISPQISTTAIPASKEVTILQEKGTITKVAAIGLTLIGGGFLSYWVKNKIEHRVCTWGVTPSTARWAGLLAGLMTASASIGTAAFLWNKL